MSENNWETQPRLSNGEFTFRYRSKFFQNTYSAVIQDFRNNEIMKITRGGSYNFLRTFTYGRKSFEIHHMPAVSVSPLSRGKSPCIIMGKEDHRQTSSYGSSKKAIRYRKWQAKLISEGKFLDAELMDVKNIVRKFGEKYKKAIDEKLDYEKELENKGVI